MAIHLTVVFLSEKKFSVNRNRVYIRNRFAERYANNSILVTEKLLSAVILRQI